MSGKTLVGALAIFALGTQGGCLGFLFNGDGDNDGLKDSEEKDLGLDPKNPDSDGDGLNDGDEVAANSDPLVADSDGDGLNDGEEVNTYGTDPQSIDTDGDGYRDSDEVTEGSDPTDAGSLIYQGGWPYNYNKESMKQNEIVGETAKMNKQFGRFTMTDQFGDKVDFYDFADPSGASDGKPVILDLSEKNCYWCEELAMMLEGDQDTMGGGTAEDFGSTTACWDGIRTGLKKGDFYWVTALDATSYPNYGASPPTNDTPVEWTSVFPNKHIPVVADKDEILFDYMSGIGWPTVMSLDSSLAVTNANGDAVSAMQTVCDQLGY